MSVLAILHHSRIHSGDNGVYEDLSVGRTVHAVLVFACEIWDRRKPSQEWDIRTPLTPPIHANST